MKWYKSLIGIKLHLLVITHMTCDSECICGTSFPIPVQPIWFLLLVLLFSFLPNLFVSNLKSTTLDLHQIDHLGTIINVTRTDQDSYQWFDSVHIEKDSTSRWESRLKFLTTFVYNSIKLTVPTWFTDSFSLIKGLEYF